MANINEVPFDEEIEKSVICCMLIDNETADKGLEMLNAECFYSRRCRLIFSCIKELSLERENIDPLTVRNRLLKKTEEELRKANINSKDEIDVSYFADITVMPAVKENLLSYCEEVKKKYLQRELIRVCNQIVVDCRKNEKEVYDVLDIAQRNFFNLSKRQGEKDFEYLEDLIPIVLDKIDEASKTEDGITGVPSGFKVLDNITQGFQKQDLIVIAARPSTGKTSLALNIAYNMAKLNKYVAFFSLEMGGVSLAQRLISMEAVIPSGKIRSGRLSDKEFDRLIAASEEICTDKIIFNSNSYLTIAELTNKCRFLKNAEHKLDCIIIDYLQLMHAGIEGYNGSKNSRLINNRQEEVAEISKSLKALAKELEVPLIALAQLHRSADDKKETQLSDIRESGAIEQDADLVIFIEKQRYDSADATKEEKQSFDYESDSIFLNIAKHRNGQTKKIQLRFDRATTKFSELSNISAV